jgi:hypothetical protein
MQAAYLLANRPSPTVQDPSKWSPAFLDFISQCLQKVADLIRTSLWSVF